MVATERKHKIVLVALFLLLSCASIYCDNDNGRYRPTTSCPDPDTRTFDGVCNNLDNKLWGAAGTTYARPEGLRFADGIKEPVPEANARRVSRKVFAERPYPKISQQRNYSDRKFGLYPDSKSRNHMFVIFGQFITHDLSLNRVGFSRNLDEFCAVRILDMDDPLYEAQSVDPTVYTTGYPRDRLLSFKSDGVIEDGAYVGVNTVSTFIDASTIYGSDNSTAYKLRTRQGGKLNMTESGLLPQARDLGVSNQCSQFDPIGSAAGDFRSDENPVLLSLHTMFAREHNRVATKLARENPSWDDQKLYSKARNYVIALIQHIAMDEYLPLLVGEDIYKRHVGDYDRYDKNTNPTLINAFALAGVRVQHDQINFPLLSIDNATSCSYVKSPGTFPGYPTQERAACLKTFTEDTGIDAFIRGALVQYAQEFDGSFNNDMTNIYSKADTAFCNFDVESVNIFRANQHGVIPWKDMVQFVTGVNLYTLPGCAENTAPGGSDPIECFFYVTNNITMAQTLRDLYKKVSLLNSFVGFVTESNRTASGMGNTAAVLTAKSFAALRDGDRWWYENKTNRLFSQREISEIKETKLIDVIRRNTNVRQALRDAFLAKQVGSIVDNDAIMCSSTQTQ